MKIQRLRIDCNSFAGDLCRLAGSCGSDKSMLNTVVRPGASGPHRHAYTPIYDMLFAARRFTIRRVAEIGIENGAGIRMLRSYFPNAEVIGFERHPPHLATCEALDLAGVRYLPIDVTNRHNIISSFERARARFDLIIDDSSHRPEDQVRIISAVYDFLAPGGTLIVEDIFEDRPEEVFSEAIEALTFDFAAFVFPEHAELHRGWKNDKLLILVKSGRAD